MENLKYIPFGQVDFSDTFFDSLKSDYSHGFIEWFEKKSNSPQDKAYVLYDENKKN
ncbi:hypothetical protein OS42_09900 [Dickeya oryzae]